MSFPHWVHCQWLILVVQNMTLYTKDKMPCALYSYTLSFQIWNLLLDLFVCIGDLNLDCYFLSWLPNIFPIRQWRTGCCAAFLVPCQSRSQFTFKASAQLSTPVVKPTLSIHIVSVKMKMCISTVYPKHQHVAPAFSLMSLGGLGSDVTSVKQEVSFFLRLWTKSMKTSCVLESSEALCIKISVQVERHKIRSVSPHCIINTPLFISLPIESVHKKMLPPMKIDAIS